MAIQLIGVVLLYAGFPVISLLISLFVIVYTGLNACSSYLYQDKPNYALCKIHCHPKWEYAFSIRENNILYPLVKDFDNNNNRWYRYCPGCGLLETKLSAIIEHNKNDWFMVENVVRKDVLVAHYVKEWVL